MSKSNSVRHVSATVDWDALPMMCRNPEASQGEPSLSQAVSTATVAIIKE